MPSYHSSAELPVPSADQIAHSKCLISCITDHIAEAGGVISFRDYMQHCLYEPGLGYYSAGSTKLGAAGDFTTAPEISPLFGSCLARQAVSLFAQGLEKNILEFGAGSGKLCLDVINQINDLRVEWLEYLILEPSADFQQRQRQFLQQHLSSQDFQKIGWLTELPETYSGLVLANEVLDAMPVNVVLKNGKWIELGVGYSAQKFEWMEYSDDSEAVRKIAEIDETNDLTDHYCSEVNMNYQPWCRGLSESFDRVVMLIIDYGYEQAQYYHPQRHTGTLMCFYQHRSHPDPFVYPGLQDITAFVDFDAFAEAAIDAGFVVSGMTTQAHFLMRNGLLEVMEEEQGNERERLKQAQQIKTLTLPGEMGEKFKVMGLQKNVQLNLSGF